MRAGRLCLPSADGGAVPTSPLPSPCTLEVSELRGEGQGHPAVQFRPEPALPSTLPDHGDAPCARPCPPPRVCVCTRGASRPTGAGRGGSAPRVPVPDPGRLALLGLSCPHRAGGGGRPGGARAEGSGTVGLRLHRSRVAPLPGSLICPGGNVPRRVERPAPAPESLPGAETFALLGAEVLRNHAVNPNSVLLPEL